jgi:membrane-bound lytic murein transglycosylase D
MRAANQRPIVALGILAMLWALSGCSSSRGPALPPATGDSLATAHPGAGEPSFPAESDPVGSTDRPQLDVEHPRVQTLVAGYQTTMRPTLERALQRGNKYLPSMKSTLREEGVPAEFAYGVPIVESGYSLHATSHAGAVGPWQFIRGTGKRYGLRIDGYVDERRDPEKATRAAARYLRDLYDRFGDWHLALAAYNTGEGNIERIKRKGCEDFWEMRDRGFLPSETSEYVPKVLAAMEVASSAKRYGIDVAKSAPQKFDLIQVTRPISLKAVAQLTSSDLDTIKELNPALKRGVVPPDGYEVRLPEGTRDQFTVALASYREPAPVLYAVERRASGGGSYKVRRGDTLSRIAKRHGVSVQALQRANRIRNGRGLQAGQRLHIPGRSSGRTQIASASRSKRASANRTRRHVQKSSRPTSAKRRAVSNKRPVAKQKVVSSKRPVSKQKVVNKRPVAKQQVSKAKPRGKVANAPKRGRGRYN